MRERGLFGGVLAPVFFEGGGDVEVEAAYVAAVGVGDGDVVEAGVDEYLLLGGEAEGVEEDILVLRLDDMPGAHNLVKATIAALDEMRSPAIIAQNRGISVDKVFNG